MGLTKILNILSIVSVVIDLIRKALSAKPEVPQDEKESDL